MKTIGRALRADGQDTIVLSMVTGHGRATPLLWKTVGSSTLKGNQRRYEYELLCRLREVLPAGVKVTVVADRGFAYCKLFYALTTELAFEYVIRLRGDIYVTNARGERRAAAAWVGAGGRARRLVGARVTDAYELPVGVVVCVHDPKMDEPWCLVASEATIPTRVLIRYYGKRWGIEAGFRDIKDMRFGMGLSSIHVSRPDRRDRLLLISALAIAVLSLLGAAGERIGYDRWLKANTVKRRTHSLFRQGLMLYHHLPNWPEDRVRPLMATFRQHAHGTAGVSRGLRRDLMACKMRGCMRTARRASTRPSTWLARLRHCTPGRIRNRAQAQHPVQMRQTLPATPPHPRLARPQLQRRGRKPDRAEHPVRRDHQISAPGSPQRSSSPADARSAARYSTPGAAGLALPAPATTPRPPPPYPAPPWPPPPARRNAAGVGAPPDTPRRRQRNPPRLVQRVERFKTTRELGRPARIHKPELRAHPPPHRRPVVQRLLRHNPLAASLRLRRTKGL